MDRPTARGPRGNNVLANLAFPEAPMDVLRRPGDPPGNENSRGCRQSRACEPVGLRRHGQTRGKEGWKKHRERKEYQLGALGLAVDAVVRWNTIYRSAALYRLRPEGMATAPDDDARLARLEHKEASFLGRDPSAVIDQVFNGELRPLRDPR